MDKKSFDFRPFQEKMYPDWEKQFRSGPETGAFSYKIGGPTSCYGTTDMLISRYIINDLDLTEEEKNGWGEVINRFHDPRTGWYNKSYTIHHREHTTAYAVAALKLIDREPLLTMRWKDPILASEKAMEKWINRVNWSIIWPGSHVVTGVPGTRPRIAY